jgi:serine/threonine-protein kinase HipA
MAEREVEVVVQLGGQDVVAGRTWSHRRRKAESATFSYAEEYLARDDAYPLDPLLPLGSGQIQTPLGRPIFGAFSDCAPDRWGRMLIQRHHRRRAGGAGDPGFGEVDYLLGVRDVLRQGALRFRDPETGGFMAGDGDGVPHLIDLPDLLNLADRAERDVADGEELAILLRGGSSLGGARPKAHVLDRDGRVAIAKFPRLSSDEWDVVRWEAVTLDLARASGITTPPSRLHEIDGKGVLLIDRFDRRGDVRIGYVSAMTMLEAVDGEERTYLDLVEVVEEASDRVTEDLRELWRRAAFSVLVSNTDNHLRNHGFLRLTSGGWSQSPAFDLNPDPQPGPKLLSTAIDESSNAADLGLLLENAEFFRLGATEARDIVAEVSAATSGWRDAARRAGSSAEAIAQMEPAFEHDSAALAAEIRAAVG